MLKSYFVVTDKGPFYNINQDHYLVNLENRIFAVIDGFGGSGIGDMVAKNLCTKVAEIFVKIDHDRDATLKYYFDQRRSIECNFLINGLLEFHQQLTKENSEKSLYQRGGASAAFILMNDQQLSLVTIGKIHAFLIRNDKVVELNICDDGQSFEASIDYLTNESWPKSGFGLFDPLNFAIKDFKVINNDQIFLLSSGALKGLTKIDLGQIAHEEDDKAALQNLLQQANANGNRDNQTAMLLRF